MIEMPPDNCSMMTVLLLLDCGPSMVSLSLSWFSLLLLASLSLSFSLLILSSLSLSSLFLYSLRPMMIFLIVADPRMVSCGPAMSLPSTLATSEPPPPAASAAQQTVEGASAREDRPAGAEGGFHPGHPPPLGHPRGPGGPPRGVTR